MTVKKEIIALILAGGQGSRLGVLTKKEAKPAVLFGGKYRIIDFSLSNCINSNIDTVGILTQYQPMKLNSHIGIGKPWDLDRMDGGVAMLSPYMKAESLDWYKGTANSVYHNIEYVDKYEPSHVAILSGDHIYKMDYSKMLYMHKLKDADATISVVQIAIEDASRFGIVICDENGKITGFEEKPESPRSNLASMGVYIFNWNVLKEYLIKDEENDISGHDFGKDIIPAMLADSRNLYVYKYTSYWRDVGTIQAYWEASMDLVKRVPDFNLYDRDWKIYTPNPVKPAHYVGPDGIVKKSIVAEGCTIYGTVRNSVLFPGVYIGEGALIEDSVVMSNSRVESFTILKQCIICENCVIGKSSILGEGGPGVNEYKPDMYNSGITVVGERTIVPDGMHIGRNVMIDIDVSPVDFCSDSVPSGGSIFKGGICE